MSTVETWQEAVATALGELGIEGLGAIAFEALEAELPLLRDEPDLAEAARASVVANVALILDFASGTAALADLEPPPAAVAFTRELARRNVPVAELRPLSRMPKKPRPIGLARGELTVPPSFFEPLPAELEGAFRGDT